jgi:putative ABC transport system permease protein
VLVWRLAWRNLWRHRGRSLVVGGILFLGALLLTFGNGVVGGMEQGLRRQVVESFTGDVVVTSSRQQDDNVFLSMMGKEIEPLYRTGAIQEALSAQPWVKSTLPMGKNMIMALHESEGNPGYLFLLGVDFAKWTAFFPGSFEVRAGRLPGPGEAGLVLPSGANEQLHQAMGQVFLPKGAADTNLVPEKARRIPSTAIRNEIVLMGFSNSMATSDLRLDIKAVGKFRALNTIWGHFALADIESYRSVQGYLRQDEKVVELSQDQKDVMASDDLDALLAGDAAASEAKPAAKTDRAPSSAEASVVDNGSDPVWNLVLVKLRGETAENGAARMDSVFQARHLPARAVPWHKAVGVIGSLAMLIRGALLGFVGLLFVVAGIVIANTLAMSALERTTEIGMMRAVGATRLFIGRMMLSETAVLALVFGGAGIVLGAGLVEIVPMLGIHTGNDLLQMVYGGEVFRPLLRPQDIASCFVELGLVVALASLYPAKLATSITPLDAIA